MQFGFSPSPPWPMEEWVKIRSRLIFKYLPLTPTLSPFGGERESDI